MPLISAHNLTHAFGADDLFEELNLTVESKERIGLVGPNGVGKSTLLQILAGLIEPDEGEIHRQRELQLGYLRQEAILTFAGQENSIFEEMLSVFATLVDYERELRSLEASMATGDMSDTVVNRYSDIQTRYEAEGGYEYQVNIRRVLDGLGFPQGLWQLPLSQLSGGQKTRVLLGRLLLEEPEFLILDEPTNHLDAAAVSWLEATLRNWNGSLLIVSHDRYFLDRTVNRIWDMTPEAVTSYKGNYSEFVEQRQRNWERELKLFESERERMESELGFIRKHIAGGKTDIAKGKLKRLTRDIVLLEEVGLSGREGKSWLELGGRVRTLSANDAARRLRQLRPPDNAPPKLNIKFDNTQVSPELVLRTQRLNIGYAAGMVLFSTEKLRLWRHDRIALIGPNGSGKSTLLRTLVGEIEPLRGEIEFSENIITGYFAQAHEQLNSESRVIDEILLHSQMAEQGARKYLAQYLFKGHDVFKYVRDLSGGERGRLALAILALSNANLLLLDEPTNHLDIPSQEVLQQVLERFDGTILLVSHDRYLVDKLATQIWEIDGDKLNVFEGSYAEFINDLPDNGAATEDDTRGRKVESMPIDDRPIESLDLSWVEELESAEPTPQPAKTARQSAQNPDIARAQAYLANLRSELEVAESDGDEEEIAWLLEEIDTAEADIRALEER